MDPLELTLLEAAAALRTRHLGHLEYVQALLAQTDRLNALNAAVNRALINPALKDRFIKMGLEIGGGSPQDLQALIRTETAHWAPVVKASGFTAD